MGLGDGRSSSVCGAAFNGLRLSKTTTSQGPHQQKGHTGCMHHVITGFCQVGALPTLISQQLEDGKAIHSLPSGGWGKTEV